MAIESISPQPPIEISKILDVETQKEVVKANVKVGKYFLTVGTLPKSDQIEIGVWNLDKDGNPDLVHSEFFDSIPGTADDVEEVAESYQRYLQITLAKGGKPEDLYDIMAEMEKENLDVPSDQESPNNPSI